MSESVDKFCEGLRERLNAIEARVKSIKANVDEVPGKAETAVKQLVAEARTKFHAQKEHLDKALGDLKKMADLKKTETEAAIQEWKAERDARKLNARAEEAQKFAEASITYAAASIDRARDAIFDAVDAWMDVEEAK